jgi:hypothetical protein
MAKLNLLLLAVLVATGALASACTPALQVPERVSVEVPVACVRPQDVPARPALRSEADLYGMDRYRRTLAAMADKARWRSTRPRSRRSPRAARGSRRRRNG